MNNSKILDERENHIKQVRDNIMPVHTLDSTALVLAICAMLQERGMDKEFRIPHIMQESPIFLGMLKLALDIVGARKNFGATIDVAGVNTREIFDLLKPFSTDDVIVVMRLDKPIPFKSENPKTQALAEAVVDLITKPQQV